MSLREVVDKLKQHFNLKNLRIALANGKSLGNNKLSNARLLLLVLLFILEKMIK
jgi:hypothetical protein